MIDAARYREEGFLIVPSLIPSDEVGVIRQRFELIWKEGVPGFFERRGDTCFNDFDASYPRIIHPHRFDPLSRHYLLDRRITDVVSELIKDEPIAAQTMYYWKPPGTKGQAPHQDNLYLKAEDAEGCMAAWLAVDGCDEENGCLMMVPRSNGLALQCPGQADSEANFSTHHVETPQGYEEIAMIMTPGDVVFFGGHTIHGSGPNKSQDRCRRSFICHYIGSRSTASAGFYNPLIRMDGTEFHNGESNLGSPCGVAFEGPH